MSKSVFLVSECGTGKSLMGAVIAHVVGRQASPNYKAIVVGPPHLTREGKNGSKWHREITGTIPGARTVHLESPADLLKLPATMAAADGPLWVICSRNFLKLGPPWRSAFGTAMRTVKEKQMIYDSAKGKEVEVVVEVEKSVPICPSCAQVIKDADDIPVEDAWLHKGQRTCKNMVENPDETERECGSPLWQYTWPARRDGTPNMSEPIFFPAGWMKGHVKFDIGIFDEVHELKGGGTAQGQMLGTVAACCNRLIALTGTLFGGKASDLYHLMWRLCPDRMRALGFDYKGSIQDFVTRYGILQRVIDPRDEDVQGTRSKRRDTNNIVEKVGIVPTLFTDLLLDRAVFLSLDDIVPHLPPGMLPPRPKIEIMPCDLAELEGAYGSMQNSIVGAIKTATQGKRPPPMGLIAAMFNGLDCYPDHPFDFGDITMRCEDENGDEYDQVICSPPDMPDVMYEKDRALVRLVKGEVAKGRRCLVYTVHTNKRPVGDRLERALSAEGIKCAVLENVDTSKREEWVAKQKAAGVQVIITHPAKVETGLDLLDWPTIIFHSIGLKPFTFRQAGARAWRIGQKARCRIIILCYAKTMQETIASLMMQKLRAATRLEGQILEDLSSIGDGDDIADQILKSIDTGQRHAVEAYIEEELEPVEEVLVEAEMDEGIVYEPDAEPAPATAVRIQTEVPDAFAAFLSGKAKTSNADVLANALAEMMG